MSKEPKVSKALKEVWAWKEACYREVAHLPRRKALQTLIANADRTARRLKLDLKPMSSAHPLMVAEKPAEYGSGPRTR